MQPQRSRSIGVMLIVACAAAGCARTVREADLFHPDRRVLAAAPRGAEAIALARPDAVLRGWRIAAPGAPRLLYFGGNGETCAGTWPRLDALARELRVEVVAFDHRGYGASDGSPTLAACAADAVAMVDWARARTDAAGRPLIVYGRSIGSAFAAYAAARCAPAALVLEAPPTTPVDVIAAWDRRVPWWMFWMSLQPDEPLRTVQDPPIVAIARVVAPTLVIHGDADEVIPVDCGRRVHAASASADKRLLIVPGGRHNDLRVDRGPILPALRDIVATAAR